MEIQLWLLGITVYFTFDKFFAMQTFASIVFNLSNYVRAELFLYVRAVRLPLPASLPLYKNLIPIIFINRPIWFGICEGMGAKKGYAFSMTFNDIKKQAY